MATSTASFLPNDDAALVYASLACPSCLSARVDWRLEPTPYDEHVVCHCRVCGERSMLHVSPEQALRLALGKTLVH